MADGTSVVSDRWGTSAGPRALRERSQYASRLRLPAAAENRRNCSQGSPCAGRLPSGRGPNADRPFDEPTTSTARRVAAATWMMSSTTVASRAYAVVPARRSRWSRGGASRPSSAPAAGSARHRADASRRDRAARSPDPQPASCRRSFRRGFRARAAPSTRHRWPCLSRARRGGEPQVWVGQLGGGDGLASGTIPDWIAPIMTAVHHLLVMRSECRRGRSRRSPRSCAGARSRASTVNRGRRFAAPLCAEPARRGASVSGAACTLRETRHALARTLATPAGSRRSPQHRGLAPPRVRSRPGPGPSGPECRVDRPASGGTDVVRHRRWRTRALLAIGRITLSASP